VFASVGIVIILLAVAGFFGWKAFTADSQAQPSVATKNDFPAPITQGDLQFTVVEMQTGLQTAPQATVTDADAEPIQAKPGQQFIVVTLQVRNQGAASSNFFLQSAGSGAQMLFDTDGQTHSLDGAATGSVNQLPAEGNVYNAVIALDSLQERELKLVYQVGSDISPDHLALAAGSPGDQEPVDVALR
jgi:hypothetical protein